MAYDPTADSGSFNYVGPSSNDGSGNVYLNTPGIITRFLGYNTLPYQDWVNNSLLGYVAQQPQQSEVSNSPAWLQQIMNMQSDVYSPLSSPSAIAQAVQQVGGYGAIGYDPNATRLQLQQAFQKLGLSDAMTIDANGNIKVPNLNYDDPGHIGPITIGGSFGNDYAGLGKVILAAIGGAMGGSGGESSSPSGFGDAGYSFGAAGGSAGAGASGSTGAFDQSGSQGVFDSQGNGLYQSPAETGSMVQGPTGQGGGDGGGGITNNTGSTSGSTNMGDETGAFDQSGSEGVFDSQGNPIYEQPGYLQQLFGDVNASDVAKFLWNNKSTIGALLGAGAGAIGANSGPAGTVTTTTDVPDWLKPYVQGNVAQGASTLAGINPNNPLLPASQAQALATIRGDYLNPSTNPYLQQNVNDALGLAKSQYLGLYGGPAGLNVNNTGFQEGLTRNLGTVATQAYGQNYANERQNQNTATFGAPQLVSQANSAYFSPNQAFAGLFPNVSSTQTPYFTNTLGSIFGGAMAGGALGKAFS